MKDSATAAIIGILETLIGFDTTSRNSNLDLIAYLEDYLGQHGVTGLRIPDESGTKANLLAWIGPKDKAGYVLSGHTDTVPVDGQDWQTNPFELTRVGDRLHGRGTCDMKGFLACMLGMVPVMVSAPLTKPIILAFSYDEEVGCIGVRSLIDTLSQAAEKPLGCFVGEPTEMQPVIAHKGKRSLRATFNGKTVHSSLSPKGVNSAVYAARLTLKIDEIAARLSSYPVDSLFDIACSTAHVGVLHAGTALNIVPDLAVVDFEFRTLPGVEADALVDEIMLFVAKLDEEMKALDAACSARLEVLSGIPALDTQADAHIVRLAKRLGGRNDHAKVAYGTEAGLFASMGDIETVVIGPGSIGEAHRADEFITISEIDKCARMIQHLIDYCCQA